MFSYVLLMVCLSFFAWIIYDNWRTGYLSKKEHEKWVILIAEVWGLKKEPKETVAELSERLRHHVEIPRGGCIPHHLRAEWNRPAGITPEEWFRDDQKTEPSKLP